MPSSMRFLFAIALFATPLAAMPIRRNLEDGPCKYGNLPNVDSVLVCSGGGDSSRPFQVVDAKTCALHVNTTKYQAVGDLTNCAPMTDFVLTHPEPLNFDALQLPASITNIAFTNVGIATFPPKKQLLNILSANLTNMAVDALLSTLPPNITVRLSNVTRTKEASFAAFSPSSLYMEDMSNVNIPNTTVWAGLSTLTLVNVGISSMNAKLGPNVTKMFVANTTPPIPYDSHVFSTITNSKVYNWAINVDAFKSVAAAIVISNSIITAGNCPSALGSMSNLVNNTNATVCVMKPVVAADPESSLFHDENRNYCRRVGRRPGPHRTFFPVAQIPA
ncbi:Aste57867_1454 [Aphanomyces stellatus]|uniref:Aste57867_1454 protein n=1 Tax=Aphanomyces stellatus TaxID=120398 RepID=A0A485K7W2_9STRA|nr:hypothetical protein As57867_001453 [Aphanomyces stellatus]VFT78671.1 Aste57867_1454 [Aphanomyces stellatus]